MRAPTPLTLAGGALALGAGGLAVGRTGLRMAQATGSSLAAPDAGPWVTDLLNAAYYARPEAERDVADLRLAAALVASRWHQLGRRLHLTDVLPFHRALAGTRLRARPRGTLDHAALLHGGAHVLGDWFPEAYADPARRAYGIAFPSAEARVAFDPAERARDAALGALTPPCGPEEEHTWHTYAPVAVPDPAALVALLQAPERWPDAASALGRFTPLRAGGLPGQTFEIDLVADLTRRTPVLTRGYVTCTAAVGPEDPGALAAWVEDLGEAVQPGVQVHVGIDLTTHEGHPLGAAVSRLVVWTDETGSWIRDVGVWDPLPTPTWQAYRLAGRRAQAAFWGEGTLAESFLHQLALSPRWADPPQMPGIEQPCSPPVKPAGRPPGRGPGPSGARGRRWLRGAGDHPRRSHQAGRPRCRGARGARRDVPRRRRAPARGPRRRPRPRGRRAARGRRPQAQGRRARLRRPAGRPRLRRGRRARPRARARAGRDALQELDEALERTRAAFARLVDPAEPAH